MASFPTLSSGAVALYPLKHVARYPVRVIEFNDDSTQRWKQGAALNEFELVFADLSATDRDTLQTFFDSVKGAYDSTWDITIGGTLYDNMAFEDDAPQWHEKTAESWDVTFRIRQTAKN